MSFAVLIRAMTAAGAPPEAIAIAVEAIEASDAKLADKRAIERDRKRAQRSRDSHGTVTGQSEDKADTAPPPSPPNKSPPDPQKLTPPPTPPRNPRPRKGASGFELPDRIPGEEWRGYEEMRNRIGKPMTDHAKALAVSRLDKMAEAGWPPGVVLNHSILNNYQGLFAPKDDNDGRQRTNTVGRFGREAISGRTVAAGAAFVAAGH